MQLSDSESWQSHFDLMSTSNCIPPRTVLKKKINGLNDEKLKLCKRFRPSQIAKPL